MPYKKNLWLAILLLVVGFAATSVNAAPDATKYASAQQIESSSRGHSFILGDDNQIAYVRALDWSGVLLPTIVQYSGTRTFTREDGSKVDIAVIEEVSLPAQWTTDRIPKKYARFAVSPAENLQWKF